MALRLLERELWLYKGLIVLPPSSVGVASLASEPLWRLLVLTEDFKVGGSLDLPLLRLLLPRLSGLRDVK